MSVHLGEARIIAELKYHGPLNILVQLCDDYFKKFRFLPDMIGVNHLLQPAMEEQLVHCKHAVLPIPSEDITWFYHRTNNQSMAPISEWVILYHSSNVGAIWRL